MAKVLSGKCTKCGETVKLAHDSGDTTTVRDILKAWSSFECPGHHVEICSPYPYYWNIDSWEWTDESPPPTDEEFLTDLHSRGYETRDTDGMSGLITSFAYGLPMTNDGRNWDFCRMPSGKRIYYAKAV